MTKINAKIRLTILASLGHKLSGKEMNELATALEEVVKDEMKKSYNVGKHDALDKIEITSEEYYNNQNSK